MRDQLNFLLGRYMIFSANAPKKYPSKPFLERTSSGSKKHMLTPEQHESIMRAKYG